MFIGFKERRGSREKLTQRRAKIVAEIYNFEMSKLVRYPPPSPLLSAGGSRLNTSATNNTAGWRYSQSCPPSGCCCYKEQDLGVFMIGVQQGMMGKWQHRPDEGRMKS